MNLGEVCPECETFAGTDHLRTYDGREICVSCMVSLKLERGEYAEGDDDG